MRHTRRTLKHWEHGWLAAAILVALVALAYLPATEAGFIWDDDFNVSDNLPLRSLAGLRALWLEPGVTTQYYPLVYTSFWLEYALWGVRPLGYHIDNILLHAACALILWRLLLRLAVPGAWLAAALFALHPVQVETVAWVTERKNLLSLFFYLLAALAYFRFVSDAALPSTAQQHPWRVRFWRGYALTLILFVAALLSKVPAIILPPALLVVSWWKRGRLTGADLAATLPMFALAIPIGLLTRSLESGLGDTLGFEWSPAPVERVLQAGHAFWFYLGKLVWPVDLAFVYRRWQIDGGDVLQYFYPLAALALAGLLWWTRGRLGRAPLAALLFFVGSLAPVLGFLEIYYFRFSYVADHWLYVASIGPITLAVGSGVHWFSQRDTATQRLGVALAVALLLVLSALSWRHSHAFRDTETLWRDSLAKNPDSLLARYNLAVELQHRDRFQEAMANYELARALDPSAAIVRTNMGLILAGQGHVAEALAHYRAALELDAQDPRLNWNLGLALESDGDFAAALPHLELALRIVKPHHAERVRLKRSHARFGDLLVKHGRAEAATAHYRHSLALDDRYAPARLGLARAWLEIGRPELALNALGPLLRERPGHAEAGRLLTLARRGVAAMRRETSDEAELVR